MTDATELFEVATAAHKAGLCVLPPEEYGTKKPIGDSWKRYQRKRPDLEQIKTWYVTNRRSGIGYVCGGVSGNLEMLEFEDRTTCEAFVALAREAGLDELVNRIATGYSERTPGGGFHLLYRCPVIAGNTKLARRPKLPHEQRDPKDTIAVKIETRGEGGYVVAAPSNGRVHPSGGAYRMVRGGVNTIATITPAERAELFALARSFDELPPSPREPRTLRSEGAGERPGDAYAARTDWADILEPAGWTLVYERGDGTQGWRRPGKDRGISATANFQGTGPLYVFTSSTEFEANQSYGKFGAFAVLNHGGNYRAAARALAAQGYGTPLAPGENAKTANAEQAVPPAIAPFPEHILPPAARTYSVSAARSLGDEVPVAMVAAPLMAFTGALAGNRVYLKLKSSWNERGGLTIAIVGAPGTIKSPALRHAKWPLSALQEDAKALFDKAMVQYKAAYATWKKDQSGEEPERPRMREFFTSDVTMEALAELLARNPGISIIADELRGWVLGFDKYRAKGGNDRQQALSLWGSETIKVNRKTGDPVYVSSPVASVVGGLQPDFADAFQPSKNATDGSTERVLPVVCDHGSQPWNDVEIATEHYSAIADLFRQIDRLPTPDREPGKPLGIGIELSTAARRRWIEFFNANSRRVNAASGLEAGMLQKLSTHTARFALILHLLWHADDPRVLVTEQTMAYAIELSDWWRSHINCYLWLLGKHVANAAEQPLRMRILRLLRKDRSDDPEADPAGWVTRSVLYRELRNVTPDDLTAALGAQAAEGAIERRIERRDNATKPVELWRIATDHSHFSHFSPNGGESHAEPRANAKNANSPREVPTPSSDCDSPDLCQQTGACCFPRLCREAERRAAPAA